jgi:hypothetical protein
METLFSYQGLVIPSATSTIREGIQFRLKCKDKFVPEKAMMAYVGLEVQSY